MPETFAGHCASMLRAIFDTLHLRAPLVYALADEEERLALGLRKFGYLADRGWFHTALSHTSVDGQGNPIPWLPYAALELLTQVISERTTVFEYGSGNSTLFFARRCQLVRAVEHAPDWQRQVAAQLPPNASVSLVDGDQPADYAGAITQWPEARYDLILVDGIHRNECVAAAIPYLAEHGILIVDDAHRSEYEAGYGILRQQQFQEIKLVSMSPINIENRSAIFFFRHWPQTEPISPVLQTDHPSAD